LIFDNPKHIFVIAEAGSNWKCGTYNQDLEQAKKLIKIASDAGADAVKFQIFKSSSVYATGAGKFNPLKNLGVDEDIEKVFDNLSVPDEFIPELAETCKKNNILFMATPFSVDDAKKIEPFTSFNKIASFEINHVGLLEYFKKIEKPIILSTGASTYQEIDNAINFLQKEQSKKIGLMQCTSTYPCPISALNLGVIPKMKEKYHVPVGFSDHSIDPTIGPVTAVGLGATFIEKHFTLDKSLEGPDHSFALNPIELKNMIKAIRDTEKAIGTSEKIILPEEEETRIFAKRSLQAITDIKKNDILQCGVNFDILRPGNRIRGVEPFKIFKLEGKRSKKDVIMGDGILDYE